MSRVVVVGSGIDGLIAAPEIGQQHAVTLVTKAELADSNARRAQGGIDAAMFDNDGVESHIPAGLRAGAGPCRGIPIEVLVSAAIKRGESRGAHFSLDFPDPAQVFARSRSYRRQAIPRCHLEESWNTVTMRCRKT